MRRPSQMSVTTDSGTVIRIQSVCVREIEIEREREREREREWEGGR